MSLPIALTAALIVVVVFGFAQGRSGLWAIGNGYGSNGIDALEAAWIFGSVLFFVLALAGVPREIVSAVLGLVGGSFVWYVGNEANRFGAERRFVAHLQIAYSEPPPVDLSLPVWKVVGIAFDGRRTSAFVNVTSAEAAAKKVVASLLMVRAEYAIRVTPDGKNRSQTMVRFGATTRSMQ